MPYIPINKCGLPVTEDIRLQHRYSEIGTDLSRKTYFNKTEVLRLLQMHYMLTKENGDMDKLSFVRFMDVFLGVRNVEAVEIIHYLCCETNKKYLTGPEFVKILSLLLNGTLLDLINFWIEVYTDKIISTKYKDNILTMPRTDSVEYNQSFINYIMNIDRKSIEDHHTSVNDIVTGSELLQSVLPKSNRKESFMQLFTNPPYNTS